ncbi:MAG: adaptor protein MecA [Clostridia bacterium]|nr:adaptor protein MecA [Clostridia bacterium]
MKLTRLDNDNIRILLEKEDLEKYELSYELINAKNSKTKQVFWNIVNTAKERSGFDPNGNKILIEAFPKSNGEVLLYVTRLPEEKYERAGESGKSYLFAFADTDAFIGAFKELSFTRLEIIEKRYYTYKNKRYIYFLPLSITRTDAKLLDKLILAMYEYGEEVENSNYRYHLEEYAQKCKI